MYCPRCHKQVKTWKDSYIEDNVKVVSTMCTKCNAVLKVERKQV